MNIDDLTFEAALIELREEHPHIEDELLLPLAESAAYPLEAF